MVAEMQYEQAVLGIDPTLSAVKCQRIKQLEKWGTQEHSPEMWMMILVEEVGEAAKEIAETHVKPFNEVAYREELLHVAAVACAAVQCLDDGIS